MDFSTSSHLSPNSKIPVIIMVTNSSPNSVWLLRMAKTLPFKHAMTCYMHLMRWPILTASLASTGSRRFRMHVFFRDQGGRIPIPSPSIRWYDPRQPTYTWPRRLSFMKSRHCPPSSWLSSVYSRVWVHLMGNSSHVGLSMIITSGSVTHKLVKSFASFQCPWLMESPSHLLWLNLPLLTDLSLFGIDTETQYVFLTSIPAIWNVGKGYANMAFIRDVKRLENYSHFLQGMRDGIGNGSGQWATVSGPSRAQKEFLCATAWRDIRDTPKEDNERGPL